MIKVMKINKKFIGILAEMKSAVIGNIIEEMNFLEIKDNTIQNPSEHYETLERILYTVWFLEKNKLIETVSKQCINMPSFNFTNFLKGENYLSKNINHIYERIDYLDKDLIKGLWQSQIKITPKFYSFIDNNYKTDEQKEKLIHIWLPIGIAIFAPILTGFLIALFNTISSDSLRIIGKAIVSPITIPIQFIVDSLLKLFPGF